MTTSADARSITFDVLAKSKSGEATQVLMEALECDDGEARRLAATTVVKRRGHQSLLEIIRRVDSMDEDTCCELSRSPGQFRGALQEAILQSDQATRDSAVEFIRRTGNFEQVPLLLDQLESDEETYRENVSRTLIDLTTRLSERLRTGNASILPALDAALIKKHRLTLLGELNVRTNRFASLTDPETVIRVLLTIGSPEDTAIRNLFFEHGDQCRNASLKLLQESDQPALMNLLFEYLTNFAPPLCIMDVVQSRNDMDFILHFLNRMPERPSQFLKANLAKLEVLSWLKNWMSIIDQLPPELHDRLIVVADHVPLDEQVWTELRTWMVRHSAAAAREAASDVLTLLPAEEARQILHDALVDDDPEIEAWATHCLRSQKLPDTFQQLLERLDRNLDVVRDAARDELSSFDLNRLLKIYGRLTPEQSLQCGKTLLKIDPNAPAELISELTHPFRQRRMRAIEATAAIGFVDEVLPTLLESLNDPEVSVRCAAIHALGSQLSVEVIEAIRELTSDESRSVRSAAEEVLASASSGSRSTLPEFQSQF